MRSCVFGGRVGLLVSSCFKTESSGALLAPPAVHFLMIFKFELYFALGSLYSLTAGYFGLTFSSSRSPSGVLIFIISCCVC